MKKNFKKVVATTFACLLALQTAIVPTHATTSSTSTVRCITHTSGTMDQLSFGVGINARSFMPLIGTLYNNYSDVYSYFDLTSKLNQLSQITNPVWKIGFYDIPSDGIYIPLYSVKFVDNQDNVIMESNYSNFHITYETSLDFSNKLKQYDLNYDGLVTITDVQLAQQFALNMKSESSLQVKLGDTNSDGTIDLADVQYIMKVALGTL